MSKILSEHLSLNPNHATVLFQVTYLFRNSQRAHEALPFAERAVGLEYKLDRCAANARCQSDPF